MESKIEIISTKLVTPKGKDKGGWWVEAKYEKTTRRGVFEDKPLVKINPHPDLVSAIQNLRVHICKLSEQYDATGNIDINSMEARGFSMKGEDDNEGLTLTGVRELSTGRKITINTPFIKWGAGEEAYPDMQELNKAIDQCLRESHLYLFEGKCADDLQGDLFNGDEGQTEKPPTQFSTALGAFIWAKLEDKKVFLPLGVYDEGVMDIIQGKLEKLGGVKREDNELIYDFEKAPEEKAFNKLSGNKNKYLNAA